MSCCFRSSWRIHIGAISGRTSGRGRRVSYFRLRIFTKGRGSKSRTWIMSGAYACCWLSHRADFYFARLLLRNTGAEFPTRKRRPKSPALWSRSIVLSKPTGSLEDRAVCFEESRVTQSGYVLRRMVRFIIGAMSKNICHGFASNRDTGLFSLHLSASCCSF